MTNCSSRFILGYMSINVEKKDRNEQLIKRWYELEGQGRTTVELVKEFGISTTRIYQIINRYLKKKGEQSLWQSQVTTS